MNNLQLTEEQQTQIQEEFTKNPDLRHITQIVFNDDTLDGRSKEGRAVRAFLINNNLLSTIAQTMRHSDTRFIK